MISPEFLSKIEIFAGVDEDDLTGLSDFCQLKAYRHNERLFNEGDEATCFWAVKEGRIDLRFDLPARPTSPENAISTQTEFMTFGWSSLVPPFKYRLSAYCANKECKVVKIEAEKLKTYFAKHPQAGYRVMTNLTKIIGSRFHQLQERAWVSPYARLKVTVHMATCGIAAGARAVMTALLDEMAMTDRLDIRTVTGGCIGRCDTEPNVTVEIEGEQPVIYQKMTPEKMRQVFKNHVLGGKIQADFQLENP